MDDSSPLDIIRTRNKAAKAEKDRTRDEAEAERLRAAEELDLAHYDDVPAMAQQVYTELVAHQEYLMGEDPGYHRCSVCTVYMEVPVKHPGGFFRKPSTVYHRETKEIAAWRLGYQSWNRYELRMYIEPSGEIYCTILTDAELMHGEMVTRVVSVELLATFKYSHLVEIQKWIEDSREQFEGVKRTEEAVRRSQETLEATRALARERGVPLP